MNSFAAILLSLAVNVTPAVTNPSFETLNETTPVAAGWSYTCLPGQSHLVRYGCRTENEPAMTRALSISLADDHPDTPVAYNAHQDIVGCEAGKTYRVSAKVKTSRLTTLPMLVVQCWDESQSKVVGIARSEQRALTQDISEWEQVEARITIPEGTSTVKLRIGIPSEGNAGGTALFDDVVFEEAK